MRFNKSVGSAYLVCNRSVSLSFADVPQCQGSPLPQVELWMCLKFLVPMPGLHL